MLDGEISAIEPNKAMPIGVRQPRRFESQPTFEHGTLSLSIWPKEKHSEPEGTVAPDATGQERTKRYRVTDCENACEGDLRSDLLYHWAPTVGLRCGASQHGVQPEGVEPCGNEVRAAAESRAEPLTIDLAAIRAGGEITNASTSLLRSRRPCRSVRTIGRTRTSNPSRVPACQCCGIIFAASVFRPRASAASGSAKVALAWRSSSPECAL